jgi:hypothetical protein
MRNITRRSTAFAAAFVLALSSMAYAAPKAERANKYLTISGKVLKVNVKARMLLVSQNSTNKLYVVSVPEGASFKITFGMYMRLFEPDITDVFKNDRVKMNCTRADGEHFAQLEDGRKAVLLTAAR